MDYRKFSENVPSTIEVDGITYYFAGYLISEENIILRVRPVNSWIRQNALIGADNSVYIPKFDDTKKKGK